MRTVRHNWSQDNAEIIPTERPDSIDPRNWLIVQRRLAGSTYRVIADEFGINVPRARQIETQTIRKIRKALDPEFPKAYPAFEVTPKLKARFWSNVKKGDGDDACWEWQGMSWTGNGPYGIFYVTIDGESLRYKAHRVAYLIEHGVLPKDNGCHTCDNKKCVRPKHIYDGTDQDNMRDRDERGRTARGDRSGRRLHPERAARGERAGQAKLTDSQVRTIRHLHRDHHVSGSELARLFGVTPSTANKILRGVSWSFLGPAVRSQ